VDGSCDESDRTFYHLREEGNLDFASLVKAGVLESNRGFQPSEFKFLIGTRHIDPENGLPYLIEKVGKHKNKLITVERKLINLQTGLSTGATDIIHALDAMTYFFIMQP
jgi:hypothetical protein